MKTERHTLQNLRNAIELYYDHQRARIAYDHRASDPNKTARLGDDDKAFMDSLATESAKFEKGVLRYAAKKMNGHEIYEWLTDQRGIAATFALIFMGYIDIEKTPTASALWSLCGLAVGDDGRAAHPVKGQKLRYNPHLKSRCYLLGESFLKAGNTHWRAYYDDYKARKQRQICVCMLCKGTGVFTPAKEEKPETVAPEHLTLLPDLTSEISGTIDVDRKLEEELDAELAAEKAGAEPAVEKPSGKKGKPKKCPRCKAGDLHGWDGDRLSLAPWGRNDKHLHIASMRYMVKMFLIELYRRWRTYEGLEVRVPYSEEYHERMKISRPAHGR